jgi:hypothetical protein
LADKELREAIIKVHENNKRELPFIHFKRPNQYLYLVPDRKRISRIITP